MMTMPMTMPPPATLSDNQLLKFFIDNATGLSVSVLSLYFMFRLFDKHLTKLTWHLESLHQLVIILQSRGERYERETEGALRRIEQKIDRGSLSPDWLPQDATQHAARHTAHHTPPSVQKNHART